MGANDEADFSSLSRETMKVALVYDWLTTFGGAEQILLALYELFPQAYLYTLVYNKKNTPWADIFKVKPSFLQKFPFSSTHHQLYPFLTPLASESFDFSAFDMVISVTSADVKGIITKPSTCHISYILTPTRYLWSHKHFYFNNKLFKFISGGIVSYLTKWDKVASYRPDYLLAISKTVQKRIQKYYQRESKIIYPPVDINKFQLKRKSVKEKNFFLVVSRLNLFKRIDLVIKACNQLKVPLIIVGEGRAENYLKSISGPTIKFLGNLTEERLIGYYQNCRAVVVAAEEDFGLVAVEAQAAGKGVIAFKAGGNRETVKEGVTGVFFPKQEKEDIIEAINNFRKINISKQECINNSKKFDKAKFQESFLKTVIDLRKKYFANLNL